MGKIEEIKCFYDCYTNVLVSFNSYMIYNTNIASKGTSRLQSRGWSNFMYYRQDQSYSYGANPLFTLV